MTETWLERIVKARKRGRFTKRDMAQARSWTCCAVGEQKQQGMPIPYLSKWAGPIDENLADYGLAFHWAVLENKFDEAERLREWIEDRALVLKRNG